MMYHVGRPGEDGYTDRVLKAWNVDGHNSHTNICSSNARIGYQSWMGHDRPSSDFANAEVIFLISSHLEAGHYFNPHAQRIMEAKANGATLICVDPRLSNTGAKADFWLAPWPGTEPVMLLAIARLLIEHGTWQREFVRRWVNWETFLAEVRPDLPQVFESVEQALLDHYAEYTVERAERVCGVAGDTLRTIAEIIGSHPTKLASHTWRAAGAGNLGGWQVARCLFFLNVLTGSVGTEGGTSGNGWNKFVADPFKPAPPVDSWNELTWPIEYPLAYHEMSMLLPHFLLDGRGKLDTYFSRVYNPVWTNPDGFSWLEALKDETRSRVSRRAHAHVVGDGVVRRLRAADGRRRRAPRHRQLRDPRRTLDRLPPAGAAPLRRAQRRRGRARAAHARVQPRRGVGGERVLDRPVVAHRSRRLARHPAMVRERRAPRHARRCRRVLRTSLRRRRPRPRRGGGRRRSDAPRVHARPRCVRRTGRHVPAVRADRRGIGRRRLCA